MIRNGWKPGDEVIVPATTFVATINVVEQLNLIPVFVDVDPFHYCMDPQSAELAINRDTRAILPVNLLGQSADLYWLQELAIDNALKMVEDSCEAMFVNHDGFPVGSWGDISAFSFYMAHLITAGVGGISLTDDPELADIMRSLVNHGRSSVYISIDDDDGLEGDELAEMIRQRYAFKYPGYSSRITELQAAIALPQLHDYQDMMARRYANATDLTAGLSKHAGRLQLPAEREQGEHAYMMYGVRMRNGESKWPLMKHLEESGIETREMLPLVNQKMYAPYVATATKRGESLAVSKDLIKTGFYIGCHQGMTREDVDYVCEVVDEFFGGRRD
jgi:dTDP-4-amino-4,6-dideoxygalactose transaminase